MSDDTVTLHTGEGLTAEQKLAVIRALLDGTATRWTVCGCADGDHAQNFGDQSSEDARAIAGIVNGRDLAGSKITLPASVLDETDKLRALITRAIEADEQPGGGDPVRILVDGLAEIDRG